ncbi:2760_t:CDS:2, partial [Cetraspora pellucida]
KDITSSFIYFFLLSKFILGATCGGLKMFGIGGKGFVDLVLTLSVLVIGYIIKDYFCWTYILLTTAAIAICFK